MSEKGKKRVKTKAVAGTLAVICLLGFTFGMVMFGVAKIPEEPFSPPSDSYLGKYRKAAISTDGIPCSDIGRDVMLDGGNAVDAAIAALFCIGVVHPQSAGIGGGFFMTIYDPTTKKADCLDAREVAPMAATQDMFGGNGALSQKGGLAVAVPGELAGYWAAHQKYGKLPWERLVLPSYRLAEGGVPVNAHLAGALLEKEAEILAEPSMWYFLDETTGRAKKEGDILKRLQLANTLRDLATYGVDYLYNGTLGDRLVDDIRKRGGIITKQDLQEYSASWMEPIKVTLQDDLTVYSMPPPGSGVLAGYILNILDGHIVRQTSRATRAADASREPLTYHRIAEAFKHAYAQRTKLGDPAFVPEVDELVRNLTSEALAAETFAKINDSYTYNDPEFYGAVTYSPEDSGTSHVSVLDANGMAVSATSTVNLYFGAGFTSEQTGIILNDEMDDFSAPNVTNYFGVPPSPANFIEPGKRPMSSMTPTVVVDETTGGVRMVAGAAGGTKITTATVLTIIRNIWFGESIKEAVDNRRIHHQLFPMTLEYEEEFPLDIVAAMLKKQHNVSSYRAGAVVCAISRESDGLIYANSDFRKSGNVSGIDPVD